MDAKELVALIFGVMGVIYALYNKLKYDCLKSAAEKVANVETRDDLTGPEKFVLAVGMIEDEFPVVFKSSLFKALLEKLVQYAYDQHKDFTINYMERVSETDINTAVEMITPKKDEE